MRNVRAAVRRGYFVGRQIAEAEECVRQHGLNLTNAAIALGLSRRQVAFYLGGGREVPRYVLLACNGGVPPVMQISPCAARRPPASRIIGTEPLRVWHRKALGVMVLHCSTTCMGCKGSRVQISALRPMSQERLLS